MKKSFEEKSVWITLVSMLAIFGYYFVVAARMKSAGSTAVVEFVPLFVSVVVLMVVVIVIAHIVVAIASRPEGRDERDRLIEWRAESNASWVLGVGVCAGIWSAATSVDNVWIAHLLLLFLIGSEVVKSVAKLLYYRRGL